MAKTLTEGGSTVVIWPMMVVAAAVFPRTRGPRRWLLALAVGAIAGLGIAARLGLSNLFRRGRPPITDWATYAGGFAFPSGHTTAATSVPASSPGQLPGT